MNTAATKHFFPPQTQTIISAGNNVLDDYTTSAKNNIALSVPMLSQVYGSGAPSFAWGIALVYMRIRGSTWGIASFTWGMIFVYHLLLHLVATRALQGRSGAPRDLKMVPAWFQNRPRNGPRRVRKLKLTVLS